MATEGGQAAIGDRSRLAQLPFTLRLRSGSIDPSTTLRTLTGDFDSVLFEAPGDWIVDDVTLHEEINRGGAGVNYVYMTGLETVPEPSSAILLLLGLGAFVHRKKEK